MRLRPIPALTALTLISSLALTVPGQPARVASAPARVHSTHDHSKTMPMTDAEMKRMMETYWATHKRVGTSSAQGQPAATFTAQNFFFDHNGSSEANILVGQSVLWQWVEGMHTITSGTGTKDPNMGNLFNQPSDTDNPQFTFTFTSPGTYPFFCSPHEIQDMRGTVVVSQPTGIEPLPGYATAVGFAAAPSPNPTSAGIGFRFALQTSGRARAEVFDVRGRRVATVVDRELPAGLFAGAWDGRAGGVLAVPGSYYLRLRLPGFTDSRRFVVAR